MEQKNLIHVPIEDYFNMPWVFVIASKDYGSSDGEGKEGKLGECGYVEPYITAQS